MNIYVVMCQTWTWTGASSNSDPVIAFADEAAADATAIKYQSKHDPQSQLYYVEEVEFGGIHE